MYGPYLGKDNRLRVRLATDDGIKTVSYPKYLMEVHLNRYLDKDETVDHIDRNPTNNELSNLRVLLRSDHAKQDGRILVTQEFECPECKSKFRISGKKLSDAKSNRRKGKTGPFCSKSCVGRYGVKIQTGEIVKTEIATAIEVEYTSLKEQQFGKPID